MSLQTKLLSICMQTGLSNTGVANPENVPFLLVAPPGVGKTSVMSSICEHISTKLSKPFPLEVIACPQATPELMGGLPVPNYETKVTELFIYKAGKKLAEFGQGCLLLDEFSSAPDPVAAASLTLIQSGMLGDFRMPSSIARGAAMNEPERATAGRQLQAPESNRFCWINWKLEMDEWMDYMKGGLGAATDVVLLPNNWEATYFDQAFVGYVRQFLKAYSSMFLQEPKPEDASRPWPSPRSWRNFTRLYAAALSTGEKYNSTLVQAACEGLLGESVGAQFATWVNYMDLPDPEEVLANGADFKFPDRDDRTMVILSSVAAIACQAHPKQLERWTTVCDMVWNNKKKKDVIFDAIEYLSHHRPKGLTKAHKAMGLWSTTRQAMGIDEK